MKYWEIIADNLSKAGWSWGLYRKRGLRGARHLRCWPHRNGKRFIVHSDEELIGVSRTWISDRRARGIVRAPQRGGRDFPRHVV